MIRSYLMPFLALPNFRLGKRLTNSAFLDFETATRLKVSERMFQKISSQCCFILDFILQG